MVAAFASTLFSTNSAIAFKGLLCESAMMRIAFQSSPILSLPRSAALLLRGTFDFDPCAARLPGSEDSDGSCSLTMSISFYEDAMVACAAAATH